MNEEQADRVIELLERLNDSFAVVSDKMESLDARLGTLEETVSSFRGLSDLADSLTHEGWFTDSFAEKIGDKFNEGLSEKLEALTERLSSIAESISDIPSKIDSTSENICDKLGEIDTSISNIDLSSD